MSARTFTVAGVVALSLAGLHGQERPTFKASATRVVVDVSVRRGTTPATGLTAADFTLTDNGAKQDVEVQSTADVPLDVSIAVDISGSTVGMIEQYRADIKAMAAELRPIDQMRVVTFASDVQQVVPLGPATSIGSLASIETRGLSSVYDAIATALLHKPALGRRHLVIVFTDGIENRSIVDGDTVRALAQRSEAVMHVVLPPSSAMLPITREFGDKPTLGAPQTDMAAPLKAGGLGSKDQVGVADDEKDGKTAKNRNVAIPDATTPEKRTEESRLQKAIEDNGGEVHIGTTFVPDFKRVFRDFVASYVISYDPKKTPAPGWHELKVKVKGNYTVRSRRGYFVGGR